MLSDSAQMKAWPNVPCLTGLCRTNYRTVTESIVHAKTGCAFNALEKNQKQLRILNYDLPGIRERKTSGDLRNSRSNQLLLLARLVLHDISRHRASRDRQRRSKIHLSRPAAAREVAILGADDNLVGTR